MAFKYEGELTKPIPAPPYGLLQDDEQRREIVQGIVAEKYRKMGLLFDAHGLPHGSWEALCFDLAEAHVPGLRVAEKRPGRNTKWDWIKQAELRIAVDQIVKKQSVSVAEATRQLTTIEPWKSLVAHARGAETLRDEYTRADVRVVAMYREALAYELLKNHAARKSKEP